MTENDIKEELSRNFVSSIAHVSGVMCTTPHRDYGVDFTLTPISIRQVGTLKRYIKSAHNLDIQLKATTVSGIKTSAKEISYKLEVKNYNDLIDRRKDPVPLHLVLVIFDVDPPNCVNFSSESLTLCGKAFWYIPLITDLPSKNATSQTIKIPLANQLSQGFVKDTFKNFGIDI